MGDKPWFGDGDEAPERLSFTGAVHLKAILEDIEADRLLEPFGHRPVREIQNVSAAAVKDPVEEGPMLRG